MGIMNSPLSSRLKEAGAVPGIDVIRNVQGFCVGSDGASAVKGKKHVSADECTSDREVEWYRVDCIYVSMKYSGWKFHGAFLFMLTIQSHVKLRSSNFANEVLDSYVS